MGIMKASGQSITRLSATSLGNKTTFIEIDNLKGSHNATCLTSAIVLYILRT